MGSRYPQWRGIIARYVLIWILATIGMRAGLSPRDLPQNPVPVSRLISLSEYTYVRTKVHSNVGGKH